MARVYQAVDLDMSFCLDCHRNPDRHLVAPEDVTAMGSIPPADRTANPSTDCVACHR
jgi:hypothetical protein